MWGGGGREDCEPERSLATPPYGAAKHPQPALPLRRRELRALAGSGVGPARGRNVGR